MSSPTMRPGRMEVCSERSTNHGGNGGRLRVVSTRREVFCGIRQRPGSSCGKWKKERLVRSQGMKEESGKHEDCVSFRCTSGTQKAGLRGMKPCWLEAVLKQTRTTRHPWLIACDANVF